MRALPFSHPDRRQLLAGGGALLTSALLAMRGSAAEPDTSDLHDIAHDAPPISPDERAARLEQARRLMHDRGIDAVLLEPGASLVYFTGVAWHRSERLTAAILFAKGDPVIVTPFFEAPSVKETLAVPAEIRVWQEDEAPIARVVEALRDRGVGNGRIGVEETVRYFASDGLARLAPGARLVPAAPVVRGCRMIKSPAEIALMRRATDVTIAAYRWTWPRIREGMRPQEIAALMTAATIRLGGTPEFALVLLGEAAAYPHGSSKPQRVRESEVVLMDCGCTVQGYQSDVSRTFVPGRVPAAVRSVWETVQEGQRIGFGAARPGTPAGEIDDAVRRFYEARGYGPGYRLPGLSHRTGHGIGLDGHEPVNLVHGERTPIAPGMCFSDEPGLYLPGRFGVRLEDCFHITDARPRWFSEPARSLEQPVSVALSLCDTPRQCDASRARRAKSLIIVNV